MLQISKIFILSISLEVNKKRNYFKNLLLKKKENYTKTIKMFNRRRNRANQGIILILKKVKKQSVIQEPPH